MSDTEKNKTVFHKFLTTLYDAVVTLGSAGSILGATDIPLALVLDNDQLPPQLKINTCLPE